jgi:hypothetical protein
MMENFEAGGLLSEDRAADHPDVCRRPGGLGVALLFSAREARGFGISVAVAPPQRIRRVFLISGEKEIPLEIERRQLTVPAGVPLPWEFRLEHFEPTIYTAANLAASRPLVMKELGTIRGMLDRPSPSGAERFTWFLRQRVPPSVTAVPIEVGENGEFEFHIRGGLYEGSALGERCASKIRSRIMVNPGRVTDLGRIPCDPIEEPRRQSR